MLSIEWKGTFEELQERTKHIFGSWDTESSLTKTFRVYGATMAFHVYNRILWFTGEAEAKLFQEVLGRDELEYNCKTQSASQTPMALTFREHLFLEAVKDGFRQKLGLLVILKQANTFVDTYDQYFGENATTSVDEETPQKLYSPGETL